MASFLLRWLITAVAVFVAAHVVPGINYSQSYPVLFGAALLLGIINALVRPVLLILSIPFILITMGLFILVINALLLWLVSAVIPPFHVEGFWSAFFGAIIISLVSWGLSAFFRGSDGRFHSITYHGREKKADARVIE
jgi:putative membrane protein